MRRLGRGVTVLVVGAVVVGGGIAAYGGGADAGLRTAPVTRGEVQQTLELTGTLSRAGRGVSGILALGLLGALTTLFSAPGGDDLQRAAQAACIGVLILLVPVYTYEHHLVFAIPAAVVALVGVAQGRLGRGWSVTVALSVAVLLFDLRTLKALATALPDALGWLSGTLRELKFLALIGLLAATALLGTRSAPDDPAP